MTYITLNLDKKEFDKNKQKYLDKWNEHDYAKDEDATPEYEIEEEIDHNSFEIDEAGITFDGQLDDTGHWAMVSLSLSDEDFLKILQICLKKINRWKEAMRALETVKDISINPIKKK